MAKLMRNKDVLEIGGFLNSWFKNRIRRNQNVLLCITGPTGSSKTYDSLSCGECWYKIKFNSEFTIDNVCFSIGELSKRISVLHKENKLRKGELLILEEAGANFGNLDFQNKLSKMFNYIMQSFRSMNLILIMNLPVLTMLNKSARQLIHGHFITAGIDYEKEIAKVKPFFHQLNQHTGKSYWKYPRVRINGKIITLKRLKFVKPTPELISLYEQKKSNFVFELNEELVKEVENNEKEKLIRIALSRKGISQKESEMLELMRQGIDNRNELARRLGNVNPNAISQMKANLRMKGYDVEKWLKKQESGSIASKIPSNTPQTT